MKMLNAVLLSTLAVTGICQAEVCQAEDAPVKVSAETVQAPARVGSRADASGTVISTKVVDLVGSGEHMMGKIKGEDGEVDIVDFGLASELKSTGFEPKEGQQLWVLGRIGRINEKELILAEQVSTTKLIAINRSQKLRQESVKHAEARKDGATTDASAAVSPSKEPKKEMLDSDMEVKTIEGVVMNSRKLKIEGESEEHVIAKVQTDQGVVMLDLGLSSALPNVDLSEGKAVAATGFVGTINDKPLIVADSIGNLSTIKREALPAKK